MSSETHDAIAGPDPTLPPAPDVTGPPVPAVPVRDALKAVESAFKAYTKRLDAGRKGLSQVEQQYSAEVKRAERDLEQAGRPAKLASVGLMTRVTLTETTIKTSKGEHPLSTDMTISAEQHGTKQVVQGWVFKSDNDRREVYLHLTGPNWAEVVPFSLKNSITDARQLHEFAARAGVAARNSDNARAALAQRVESARSHLQAARFDRDAVHEAAESFVASAWDVQDLKPTSDQLGVMLQQADHSDRKVRRAVEELQQTRARVKGFLTEAETARKRVQDATAQIIASGEIVTTAPITGSAVVTLVSAGDKKIRVIKVIREATGLGLADAKNMAERTPSVILAAAGPNDAERLRASLEQVGATVVVEMAAERDDVREVAPAAVVPPTAEPVDAPAQPDVIDQIKRLGELRDAGVLTDDEFTAKKAELLSRL
jgi:ribosomal protein L7/L12